MLQTRHPDEAFSRMTLDMDAPTALARIQESLEGLTVVETARGYKIRDTSGIVIAVISDYTRDSGDTGVRVSYRVGPPSLYSSVRRGRRVHEILEPHIW